MRSLINLAAASAMAAERGAGGGDHHGSRSSSSSTKLPALAFCFLVLSDVLKLRLVEHDMHCVVQRVDALR